MSELRTLEKCFGVAPVALEFVQADFDADGAANILGATPSATASEYAPPPPLAAVAESTAAAEATEEEATAEEAEEAEGAEEAVAAGGLSAGTSDGLVPVTTGTADPEGVAEPRAGDGGGSPFALGGGGAPLGGALSAIVGAIGSGRSEDPP